MLLYQTLRNDEAMPLATQACGNAAKISMRQCRARVKHAAMSRNAVYKQCLAIRKHLIGMGVFVLSFLVGVFVALSNVEHMSSNTRVWKNEVPVPVLKLAASHH